MNLLNDIYIENLSVICNPSILGINSVHDKLKNFSYHLCSSKIYGVLSKLGGGAWALSYMLSGKVKQKSGYVFSNDNIILGHEKLKLQSCYVGDIIYNRSKFGLKYYPTVKQLLEENVVLTKQSIERIMDALELSPSRMDRPLHLISNERWNASVAIGLAQGKTIFCFPY